MILVEIYRSTLPGVTLARMVPTPFVEDIATTTTTTVQRVTSSSPYFSLHLETILKKYKGTISGNLFRYLSGICPLLFAKMHPPNLVIHTLVELGVGLPFEI